MKVNKKTGQLEQNYTVKVNNFNDKGKFIKGGFTVKGVSPSEIQRLFRSYASGQKTVNQTVGILRSYNAQPLKARVENGYNSFKQILNDHFELSDRQKDQFNYLMRYMDVDKFEEFYNQNEKLLEQTYAYDGRVTKDKHIYHPMSHDYKQRTADEIINKMCCYLGVSKKDLAKSISKERYDLNGRHISEPDFINSRIRQ